MWVSGLIDLKDKEERRSWGGGKRKGGKREGKGKEGKEMERVEGDKWPKDRYPRAKGRGDGVIEKKSGRD